MNVSSNIQLAGMSFSSTSTQMDYLMTKPKVELIGKVERVVDGDTIQINGELVNLIWVDAPELTQTCGMKLQGCGVKATVFLKSIVPNNEVQCTGYRSEEHTVLGKCVVQGLDLGRAVTLAGWSDNAAFIEDTKKYPYKSEVETALSAKNGLWAYANRRSPVEYVQFFRYKKVDEKGRRKFRCKARVGLDEQGRKIRYSPFNFFKYDAQDIDEKMQWRCVTDVSKSTRSEYYLPPYYEIQ